MQLEIGQKQDLAHRVQAWVQENKLLLVLVLVGGIGLFGILAGLTVWRQKGEEEAAAARFGLIEQARAAGEAKDWAACTQHYQALYQQSKHSPFYRVFALHGIGTCQREAGDFEGAAATFERAAKEPGHVDPKVSEAEAKKSREMVGKTNETKKE